MAELTAILDRHALNRATLARQLLEWSELPVPAALEHLVGLQAQTPTPGTSGCGHHWSGWTRSQSAGCWSAASRSGCP